VNIKVALGHLNNIISSIESSALPNTTRTSSLHSQNSKQLHSKSNNHNGFIPTRNPQGAMGSGSRQEWRKGQLQKGPSPDPRPRYVILPLILDLQETFLSGRLPARHIFKVHTNKLIRWGSYQHQIFRSLSHRSPRSQRWLAIGYEAPTYWWTRRRWHRCS